LIGATVCQNGPALASPIKTDLDAPRLAMLRANDSVDQFGAISDPEYPGQGPATPLPPGPGAWPPPGMDGAFPSPSRPPATPAPVPEPATWALLILGFGAVGASLRRRKSSTLAACAAPAVLRLRSRHSGGRS